jgi:excisionase family DNA binding protein
MQNSHNPANILKRLDVLERTLVHGLAALNAKLEMLSDAAKGQNDKLYTTDQAARFLNVSYQTLLRDQSIPHTKSGKKRLYLHSDLLQWAKTRTKRGFTLDELAEEASRLAISGTR